MTDVVAWYLHGITSADLPDTLGGLRRIAIENRLTPETLLRTEKWDFLIREGAQHAAPGFAPLRRLASTKRGIATGANEFFHIPASRASELRLPAHVLVPCVGRAADVTGFEFTPSDFDELVTRDKRVYLVTFGRTLTPPERSYISLGEKGMIQNRFLLAGRKPWYGMEPQQPAQIWAAVFGRQGLRFIHNRAGVLTLTTFHCVYPFNQSDVFIAALTLCLNVPSVQAAARAQTRVYGGGLLKFEPRDLLGIQVPNLTKTSPATLAGLAAEQTRLTAQLQAGIELTQLDWKRAEQLVKAAATEAALFPAEPSETHQDQTSHRHPRGVRKYRADQGASLDAQRQTSELGRRSQPAPPTLWES